MTNSITRRVWIAVCVGAMVLASTPVADAGKVQSRSSRGRQAVGGKRTSPNRSVRRSSGVTRRSIGSRSNIGRSTSRSRPSGIRSGRSAVGRRGVFSRSSCVPSRAASSSTTGRSAASPSVSRTSSIGKGRSSSRYSGTNRSRGVAVQPRFTRPAISSSSRAADVRSRTSRTKPRKSSAFRRPDLNLSRRPLTTRSAPPRLERYATGGSAIRSRRPAGSSVGKSRAGISERRGATSRGNRHDGRNAMGSQSGRPIDFSYSNFGRNGYERGGLTVGRDGIRVHYDRQRYRDRNHDRHHFTHGHHGEFFGGSYYPYGYVSLYDTYYHRYPYRHVALYDYTPTWTVYVDTPIVETVYVDRPARTVYVEEQTSGVDVVYPTRRAMGSAETQDDFVGPIAQPAGRQQTIRVDPQERVPVNNAWLASGDGEFLAGDYDAARRSFSYAVLEDSRDGFAALAYGLVQFALGDYVAAADALRRGLSLAPDVLDRPIDITRQYGSAEAMTTHVQAIQLHLSAHPDDAAAWFVLGYVEYSSGNAREAARAFDKAASLNRDDPYAATLRDAANRVTQ